MKLIDIITQITVNIPSDNQMSEAKLAEAKECILEHLLSDIDIAFQHIKKAWYEFEFTLEDNVE